MELHIFCKEIIEEVHWKLVECARKAIGQLISKGYSIDEIGVFVKDDELRINTIGSTKWIEGFKLKVVEEDRSFSVNAIPFNSNQTKDDKTS